MKRSSVIKASTIERVAAMFSVRPETRALLNERMQTWKGDAA